MFVSAAGGSWDISNHLLNKPETFFSIPHAVLYSGVALAIFGLVIVRMAYRNVSIYDNNSNMKISSKLIFVGISMLVVAGPIDFAWHSAFGLDGLLSPPHFVLLSGMIVSNLGAMLGIISYVSTHDDRKMNYKKDLSKTARITRYLPLIFIGLLPIWMTLDGLIGMFSLPFSNTQYFNFNPNPFLAAALATLGYPLLASFILCFSFHLGKRKFGVLSVMGAAYLAIHAITAIVPNESLTPTLTFYILNFLPILASDILLSSSANRRLSVYVSGLILGSSFLMMQYPLITYVYNEVFTKQAFVWPSLLSSSYFGMIGSIYPLVVGPAAAMGIVGAILAGKAIDRLSLSSVYVIDI
ncbi:MAG TPA: hypothetical protein VEL11_16445 [Candidatus Bathyarchaeia archaeon]|nr:hypothetical protein [Candidatus Bathyarchaeia archaeon]